MTKRQQSGGAKGRNDGYAFEDLVQSQVNRLCGPSGLLMEDPENLRAPSTWSGGKKKTPVKSDKNIIKGQSQVGVSIKNSPTSTQMQIIALEGLIFVLNSALVMPPAAKRALELFLGNSTSGETFEQMLAIENIDRSSLDCDMSKKGQEVRRKRILWSSLPVHYANSLLAYLNNPVVKRRLLDVIYREGTASEGFVDWQCWCDTTVSGKNNPDDLVVINLKEFIDLQMGEQWKVRGSNSVLALGPTTFQMKGSGKGKSKHSPQFKMSLSDLRKHYGGRLKMFEGDAASVFPKVIENHRKEK